MSNWFFCWRSPSRLLYSLAFLAIKVGDLPCLMRKFKFKFLIITPQFYCLIWHRKLHSLPTKLVFLRPSSTYLIIFTRATNKFCYFKQKSALFPCYLSQRQYLFTSCSATCIPFERSELCY